MNSGGAPARKLYAAYRFPKPIRKPPLRNSQKASRTFFARHYLAKWLLFCCAVGLIVYTGVCLYLGQSSVESNSPEFRLSQTNGSPRSVPVNLAESNAGHDNGLGEASTFKANAQPAPSRTTPHMRHHQPISKVIEPKFTWPLHSLPRAKLVEGLENIRLGNMDAGDCARVNQSIYCLPILVTIGLAKAATGEVQRWIVKHPNMSTGEWDKFNRRGVGEVQYFNHLSNNGKNPLCNECWVHDGQCHGCYPAYKRRRERHLQRLRLRLRGSSSGSESIEPTDELLRQYLFAVARGEGGVFKPSPRFKMQSIADFGTLWQTEKTPGYWNRANPRDLQAVMPSVRLVLMLRKPSAIVYSKFWYCHHNLYANDVSKAVAKCGGDDFDALALQLLQRGADGRLRYNLDYPHTGNTWEILPRSLIMERLRVWLQAYPRRQLLIWFMEDFMSDPFSFMNALQNHTGVPHLNYRDIAFRDAVGAWVVTHNSKSVKKRYPPISAKSRELLDEYFLDEVIALSTMLPQGQTLPASWLNISDRLKARVRNLTFATRERGGDIKQ